MPNDKSMEKLGKADKLLRQFPKGITASEFAEKLGKHVRKRPYGRQTGYDYLNSLIVKGKAEKKGDLFYPKDVDAEAEKPSGRQLSKSERQKLEARAEAYADAEWLARQFDSLKPLDDFFKTQKRVREELGLE